MGLLGESSVSPRNLNADIKESPRSKIAGGRLGGLLSLGSRFLNIRGENI